MLMSIKYEDEGGSLERLYDPEKLSFILYDEFLVKYKGKIPVREVVDKESTIKYMEEFLEVTKDFSIKHGQHIIKYIFDAESVEYIDSKFIINDSVIGIRNRFDIHIDRKMPRSFLMEHRRETYNFDINFYKKEDVC